MLETLTTISYLVMVVACIGWTIIALVFRYERDKAREELDQAYLSIALRGLKTPEEQEQTMQMRMVADEEEV